MVETGYDARGNVLTKTLPYYFGDAVHTAALSLRRASTGRSLAARIKASTIKTAYGTNTEDDPAFDWVAVWDPSATRPRPGATLMAGPS